MNKKAVIGVIALLSIGLLVASIPPMIQEVSIKQGTAQFVIASWDYPDEYGQGIDMIRFYENSTGSWVDAPWYYVGGELDGLPYYSLFHDSPYTLNWSAGVAMQLRVYTLFNQTFVGVESTEEAKNYFQHSVTVYSAGQEVFHQQNFTFHEVIEYGDNNYYFKHNVTLDFSPVAGEIYTVIVTYEVFCEDFDYAFASASNYYGEAVGDYTDTLTKDDTWFSVYNTSFGSDSIAYLDFPLNPTFGTVGFWNISSYCTSSDAGTVDVWNGTEWDNIGVLPINVNWVNFTVSENYVIDGLLSVRWKASDPSTGTLVKIDYAKVDFEESGWVVNTVASLIFSVSLDYWGLNMSLIFGGLILMLVSACIVAVKVRDRTITQDAGMLLLFLFCVGWGLFIGGTLIG